MFEFYENTIFAFKKSEDGATNLTDNFKVREFACKDGSDVVFINCMLPLICQAVRNWFGVAFTPNSAYRTATHNKAQGGVPHSYHVSGRAVDIPAPKGYTVDDLYSFLDKLCGNSCEIGRYSWGCHVAITDGKKRFTDSSYKGSK